jgi:hypothetical protein
MIREHIEKYNQKYRQPCDFGPILEPFALDFPPVKRLFGDLVFGTSAGHPWDRFWPPQGHAWSDVGLPLGTLATMFLTFRMNLRIIVPEMSTISEHHSHTS